MSKKLSQIQKQVLQQFIVLSMVAASLFFSLKSTATPILLKDPDSWEEVRTYLQSKTKKTPREHRESEESGYDSLGATDCTYCPLCDGDYQRQDLPILERGIIFQLTVSPSVNIKLKEKQETGSCLGGQSTVYLKEGFALKFSTAASANELIREINALQLFVGYPQIVPLKGCCVTPCPQQVGIFLNRYDGDMFDFYEKNKKTVSYVEMEKLVSNLLLSLYIIHHQGIVNSDIKDQNILFNLDNDGRLKDASLADFGKSVSIGCQRCIEQSKGWSWSDYHVAPETRMDRKISEASDVWSTGVYLFCWASQEERVSTQCGSTLGTLDINWESQSDEMKKLKTYTPYEQLCILTMEKDDKVACALFNALSLVKSKITNPYLAAHWDTLIKMIAPLPQERPIAKDLCHELGIAIPETLEQRLANCSISR